MTKTPLLALVALAACGDDPVNYSSPVGIELKAKSGEVTATMAITPDKGITTESGNPYGAFISEATRTLGRDPGTIALDKLTITLGAQSTNVTSLDQVMTGTINVSFLVNDSNNTYVAGTFNSPTGMGPVNANDIKFDWSMVGDQDIAKMLGGGFKVALNAPAAAEFAGKGAEASLQLTFTFTAFE